MQRKMAYLLQLKKCTFLLKVWLLLAPLSLQAFLRDIHHDISFMFILQDDSISSTSKPHICSYVGKGARLRLIVKPSIYSFCITHYILTLALHFCFGLIQPSASSLFMCECGHKLDAFGTNLIRCPFGNQRIATHDAIWDVMYALVQKSGHFIWREWWYTLMSRVSLWANFYTTHEDQVFIVDVMVTNPT
jgi:hypothetical protein